MIPTLDSIAIELNAAGHKHRAQVLLIAAQELQHLQRELLTMSHTFAEAAKILIDHDNQVSAANADLVKQLADANAKLPTPETLAAQQAIVDEAEKIIPSAPAPVPAA